MGQEHKNKQKYDLHICHEKQYESKHKTRNLSSPQLCLVDQEFCYNRNKYHIIQNTIQNIDTRSISCALEVKVFVFDISRNAAVGDYLITMSHSAVIISYLNFKTSEFYFITFI